MRFLMLDLFMWLPEKRINMKQTHKNAAIMGNLEIDEK